jgi:hypothetical protein
MTQLSPCFFDAISGSLPSGEAEETFGDAMEAALSQADALREWPTLVEGAFYPHRNGHFVRRITAIVGQDVYWTDQVVPGRCSKGRFRQSVSGPLGSRPLDGAARPHEARLVLAASNA